MSNQSPPPLHLVPLSGSERPSVGRRPAAAAPLDPDTQIEVTLLLRRRSAAPGLGSFSRLEEPLTRQALADRYGAAPADIELVRRTLQEHGAHVVSVDASARRLRVAGSAGALSRIFGTSLRQVSAAAAEGRPVEYRVRSGGLSVPAELDGVVTAVLGLDDRPQARSRHVVAPRRARATSYTPLELGQVYRFPPGTDGTGQQVAILELGGGFDDSDLRTYFSGLGLGAVQVSAVGVDGATNVPGGDPEGADGEVLLDIEVVGALAPRAAVVVYFAPNTDAGFLDALVQAAHADVTPVAISISWGQSEDQWTAQARTAFDDALTDAALLGVTVTAAAGDDGSTDRESDGGLHCDFPASSPHILACGGTRLEADPSTGAVTSETVWNNGGSLGATGGGVSDAFALPPYQAAVGVPARSASGGTGRGVPDVAAVADPETGYVVRVDGSDTVIGGTSAVAPLWAALVARLAEGTGRPLGLIHPALYGTTPAGAVSPGFRDITSGSNGAYAARAGWDPCTGLGVPDGTALLEALTLDQGR